MAETSDPQLMALHASGDPLAFQSLFRRHHGRLTAFFARSFSSPTEVEDLVQQTFLQLHRTRAAYDPQRPFKPWLYRLAGTLRIDALRKTYRLKAEGGELADEVADLKTPPEVVLRGEPTRAGRVREALERLPESSRVIIQLHRYEALTFEEIALVVDSTPGAVRVKASRAYSQLRDALAPHFAGGVR